MRTTPEQGVSGWVIAPKKLLCAEVELGVLRQATGIDNLKRVGSRYIRAKCQHGTRLPAPQPRQMHAFAKLALVCGQRPPDKLHRSGLESPVT